MANNRTSIEVEAKGEFSQLTRGLREVKGALSDVTNLVNRGAKAGGMFSDKDVKALDVFTKRFSDAMTRMDNLMDKQVHKLDELVSRRRSASQADISAIDKEIQKHGQYLDQLEAERKALEQMLRIRQQEAQGFGRPLGTPPPSGPSGPSGPGRPPGPTGGSGTNVIVNGISSSALSQLAQLLNNIQARQNSPITQEYIQRYRDQQTTLDRSPSAGGSGGGHSGGAGGAGTLGTLGRGVKGIAGLLATVSGVSMGIGQLMKWEQMAEQRATSWQPILQRNAGMNRSAMEGTGIGYGYNTLQTAQALDVYTQQAGRAGTGDLANIARFSRGYGVDLNTTAAIAGQFAQRGYGAPGTVLSNVAGSADSSGMTPRVLEVMEAQLGFLRSMDHSLKDNSGNNLMAYTTRINQIGNESGAQKLTGINGASILEQMGSNIFNPGNTQWQAMGMTLLSKYGGADVQSMSPLSRMQTWQNGFGDSRNVQVLSEYLKTLPEEMKKLTLQNAMGGGTTLQQAQDFGQLTNWLQKFDSNDPQMKKLLNGGNASGNTAGVGAGSQLGGQTQKWNASIAAQIEITNAKWFQVQTDAGSVLIPAKLAIEDFSTSILDSLTKGAQALDLGKILGDKLREALSSTDLWSAVGAVAGLYVGGNILKKISGGGGGGAPGTPGTPGKIPPTNLLSKGVQLFGMFNAPQWGNDIADYVFGHKKGTDKPHDIMNPFGLVNGTEKWTDDKAPIWERMAKSQDKQEEKVNTTMDAVVKDSTANKDMTATSQKDMLKNIVDMSTNGKSYFEKMKTTVDDMAKATVASKVMADNPGAMTSDLEHKTWWDQFNIKDPSTWTNWAGADVPKNSTPPTSAVQKLVYKSLAQNGKIGWWGNVQTLMGHENAAWNPHPTPNPTAVNGEHAQGLFQFLPSTWAGYRQAGSAEDLSQASVEQQTEAFIAYMEKRYGGNFGNITNFGAPNGSGPNDYHGYAGGVFVSQDQTANIHAGEELISRPKTAETLRKTGKLPSQVLNDALSGPDSTSGTGGGTSKTEHTFTVRLESSSDLSHVPAADIIALVKQVIQEEKFKEQVRHVFA